MILRSTRSRLFALVILASTVAAACDKVPLLAPTNSTITLFAAQTVLPVNGTTEVVATVIESSGTPVQNGTLVTFTTTLGSIEPREARTTNGQVSVRFNSGGQSGTAEIRALSGGASNKDALKIDIGAAVADAVQVTATPANLPSTGGSTVIAATVTDKNGNRVPGVPVGFSADNGSLSASNVITDDSGTARTTLTTTKATKVTARAGSKSQEITVGINAAPVITVTVSPTTAVATQPVNATIAPASGTSALTDVVINWGDGRSEPLGTVAGSITRSHQYCAPGPYNVTVSGTDVNGERANGSGAVAITPVTMSLSASPSGAAARQPITFTATNISSGAIISRYEWDFGDGSRETSPGPSKTHSYQVQGGYSPTVTAISSACGVLTTASTGVNITP